MAKKTEKLSALGVSKLTEPGLHPDGSGLYFQITKKGSRSWLYRYTMYGKTRDMGLGPFPAVSLKDARDRARDAKNEQTRGIDPIEARNKRDAAAKAAAARDKTFTQCAEEFIADKKSGWRNAKHRQQWRNTLKTYAEKVFKDTPVSEITSDLVMKALKPIWTTKTETARRVQGRIENVLDYARVKGYRTGENPARWKGNLAHQLPTPGKVTPVKHHPALPYAEMKAFMKVLRKASGIASEAAQFTILTAARSGEVRKAGWDEIDFKERVWNRPADHMKGGKAHRQPLSPAAIAILEKRRKARHGSYIFPGGKEGKPLSDMALTEVLRRMNRHDITIHGFRSSFVDWAHEETKFTRDEIEMSLAHKVGNDVELAYRRGDLFKKRVAFMADWAKFCGA